MTSRAEKEKARRALKRQEMGEEAYKAEQTRKRRERRQRARTTQEPTQEPTQEIKQEPRRSKTPQRPTQRTPPPERQTLDEKECYLLLSKKYNLTPKIPSRDTEQYKQTMKRLKRIKQERLDKQNEADDEEIKRAMERKQMRNQTQDIKQREIKQKEIKTKYKFDPAEALRILNVKDDEATEKTLKMYLSNINIIHKLMNKGKDWKKLNDYKFLVDVEKVIRAIDEKYNNSATASKYINSITSILKRHTQSGYKTIYNKYSKINDERKKALQATAQENKLSVRELKNYVKWDDIIKEPYTLKAGKLKASNILYVLYVAIPPRRAEYRTLYYTNDPNPKDKTKNYLVMEGFQPVKLILNDYKTAKTYGQYTADLRNNEMFKFWGEQQKIFYRRYGNPNDTQLLPDDEKIRPVFPSEKGKDSKTESKEPFITPATYINRVKQEFQQGNKKPSINLLRHSFITYTRQKQNLSISQKKAIAEQMGHSKDTADLYEKING